LRYAVDHEELVLDYQPIVRLVDHALVGMEALLRWNRPQYGLVMPDGFLPIAEESSLITDIDAWVLNQACRSAAGWLRSDASVAVNFSARDLQSDYIVSAVTGALDRSGLDPHRLTVELTETTLLADIPVIELNLTQIRALGVQVSIDDFGTGYSSLSYLRKIPAQTLKIDRSFVSVLDEDSAAQAIIAAIVTLGHALNMEIIAEGVEHPSQSAQLRELSCDSAQGYFFARPTPEIEIPRFFNGDPIGTWSYEPAISGHVPRSGRDRRFA
jgi:EAL domain-containing protein (putative c-di-GMP-specific phosphodiesterase class I)